jgi:amino acid transporter
MSALSDEKKVALPAPDEGVAHSESSRHHEGLHRNIGSRQIQLFAIGGSIGTALFVSIGSALYSAGPAGLLLAFTIYCCLLALVNNAMAEMGTYMPISGGFVRLAKHWVGEGFGFMAGVNFYLYEALTIPFEITALNIVLSYWRDDIPIGAVCACAIVAYL